MIEQTHRPNSVQAMPQGAGPDRVTRPQGEARSQVDQVDDAPLVETPVEARGGLLGKPVVLVLGVSLALAVVAGVALGFIPV